MSLLVWRDSLAIGCAEVDADHQELVGHVNRLFEAIEDKTDDKVVGTLLLDLVKYTKQHFNREEKAMLAAGYPGYQAHKKVHDELAAQVMVMAERFVREGAQSVKRELVTFLANWLVEHIIKEDRKIAPYLKGKKVWL